MRATGWTKLPFVGRENLNVGLGLPHQTDLQYIDLFDLYINVVREGGGDPYPYDASQPDRQWEPVGPRMSANPKDPAYRCSATHTYIVRGWTPPQSGPLHLKIFDVLYDEAFNGGALTVTIKRV